MEDLQMQIQALNDYKDQLEKKLKDKEKEILDLEIKLDDISVITRLLLKKVIEIKSNINEEKLYYYEWLEKLLNEQLKEIKK